MWSKGTIRINPCLRSSSCLRKVLVGLQRGDTPRCTLGIVVLEEGGILHLMWLADDRTDRVAERGGEQRELQLVDGAGGEGLRLVRWGWGAGRHGYTSRGGGRRVDLRVVCGEGASKFGPSILKPHLRESSQVSLQFVCIYVQRSFSFPLVLLL